MISKKGDVKQVGFPMALVFLGGFPNEAFGRSEGGGYAAGAIFFERGCSI